MNRGETALLHVAQVSFFVDPRQRDATAMLQDWPTLVDVADSARGAGARVSVIQASARAQRLDLNGVNYHFLVPAAGFVLADSPAFTQLMHELKPDVLHIHGLGYSVDMRALVALAPRTPILLQDHANSPPRRFWLKPRWRRCLAAAGGVAFCARAQAQPFVKAGVLSGATQVYEIPESTSRFSPGGQAQARELTGLHGDPCLLWVGNLDDNKDPMTILAGLSAAVAALPGAQLWCYFGAAPLLDRVRQRIAYDPALRDRVHLRGRGAHAEIEQAMRAADLFVLGSHREGSGYALIEALACGLSPVVADIPSFRVLTGDGAVGALWPYGDSRAFAEALRSIAARSRVPARSAARAHFERELSLAAVGRKLVGAYEDLLRRAGAVRARSDSSCGADSVMSSGVR